MPLRTSPLLDHKPHGLQRLLPLPRRWCTTNNVWPPSPGRLAEGGGGGERDNNGRLLAAAAAAAAAAGGRFRDGGGGGKFPAVRCLAARGRLLQRLPGGPWRPFPTAYFNVNPPRIHRGWRAIEQATWEASPAARSGGGGHGGDSSGGASVRQQASSSASGRCISSRAPSRAAPPCAAAAGRQSGGRAGGCDATTEAEKGYGGGPRGRRVAAEPERNGHPPRNRGAIRQTGVGGEKAAGMGMGGGLEKEG